MTAPSQNAAAERTCLRGRRAALVLVMVLVGIGTRVAAQAPSPGGLTTLEVPGGAWALTQLGIAPLLERASVPRILAQRLYDPSPAIRPSAVTIVDAQAKLDLAVRVETAARSAASGGRIALGDIKTRQTRSNVEAALEAVGAKLRERRKQYSVTLESGKSDREVHATLKALGFDVADAVARLNRGEAVVFAVPDVRVPWALSPATWSQQVFERTVPARAMFAEVLRTPNALLFWYGLLTLDDSTRRFLEASPDLVRTLSHDAAPLLQGSPLELEHGVRPALSRSGVDFVLPALGQMQQDIGQRP